MINPDEILKKENEKEIIVEERKKVDIKVNEEKGYFRKAELTNDDIKFLLGKKYVLSSHVPLGGGRQEIYLLKPSKRESNTHFFLVKAIEEYLLQFTNKVEIFETNKPDIVFSVDNKKIVIEVESGETLKKNKKLLDKKISLLNKNYDEWFFVVCNAPDSYQYSKLGKTFTRKNVCRKIRTYFYNLDESKKIATKKSVAFKPKKQKKVQKQSKTQK